MLPLSAIVSSRRGLTYHADQLNGEAVNAVAYFNMKSFLKAGGLNVAGTKTFSGAVPSEFVLGKRDVLIANTDVTPGSDIIGSAALVPPEYLGRSTFSHHVTRLRVVDGTVEPSFLAKALLVERVRHAMRAESRGTTVKMLDLSGAMAIKIGVLPHSEQCRVVSILNTLDTAIHETEAIIAKLKAVKQGLLHDLLTRGIDANDVLRPPQAEAPHLYKESPQGWIPKEWEIFSLGDVAESLVDGPFGSNLKTEHYVENLGVRVVRLQNILPGKYDDSEPVFISEKHATSLSRNRVGGGDVLIASLGDASYPVGRSCSYPVELPDAVNKADCFRFRAGKRCSNEFVMLSMNGSTIRGQVRGYEQGVTMKRVNLGNLRRIWIALPSLQEQCRIVEVIQAAHKKIEGAAIESQKLRNEKAGLMDDLLTGRVRVTPLLKRLR